jgi:hypothetical protein
MRKRLLEIQEESAQDSFLDVIANLVGVIIILVMLVGAKATRDVMRESRLPVDNVTAIESMPHPETETELEVDPNVAREFDDAKEAAIKARQEVEAIATRLVRMKQESAELDAERVTLAMHRSIVEEDMAKRRAKLSSDKQKEFDVQRKIAESQIELDKLMQEQLGLLDGPETVEELESVSTPLAREDDSDAIHLRLKNGLVSIVPFKELKLKAMARILADDYKRARKSSKRSARLTVIGCDFKSLGSTTQRHWVDHARAKLIGRLSTTLSKFCQHRKPLVRMWSKPSCLGVLCIGI